MIKRKTIGQVLKYGILGVTGVCIDALIYSVLLRFHVILSLAKGIGILTSIIFSFFGNTLWTFKEKITLANAIRFFSVYAVSLIVNILVNKGMISVLDGITAYYMQIAFFCATGASVIITFFGLKFLVYK